jgi:hypothetical protein
MTRGRKRSAARAPAAAATPPAPAPPWESALVGAVALALYLALAPPVSGDQDASELTLALAMGGVPHPTGYPLYSIAGHLFCQLLHALGTTWAFAANAWSAVGGGVAIGLFHALAVRLTPEAPGFGPRARSLAALVPAAIAGLNPVWTMSAALVEVYSWHLAWIAGMLLLFVSLVQAAARRDPRAGGTRGAAAWGLACGLGLAHHVSGVLFSVPLTLVLLRGLTRARLFRPRWIVAAVAAGLLPLAAYAFVAWRAFHPARFQWPMLEPSMASVIRHVTGAAYGIYLGKFAPADLQQGFLASYVYPFLFPGLALLLVMALRFPRGPSRTIWWGLLAAAVAQTLYTFQYGIPDPAVYFLPSLWAGLLALPALIGSLPAGLGRRAGAVIAVAGVLVLAVPWVRVAAERREGFIKVDEHLRRLWRGLPFENGIVLWTSDMAFRLTEYQLFDGEGTGRYVVNPIQLTFPTHSAAFARRFGFDPTAGLRLYGPADISQVVANINAKTPLPVAEFDAIGLTVTVLPKPAPTDTTEAPR